MVCIVLQIVVQDFFFYNLNLFVIKDEEMTYDLANSGLHENKFVYKQMNTSQYGSRERPFQVRAFSPSIFFFIKRKRYNENVK